MKFSKKFHQERMKFKGEILFSLKGLELPISTVVIVAIAVLVLVVISAFFLSQSGSQFSEIEARSKFNQLCPTLECTVDEAVKTQEDEFYKSCQVLYPGSTRYQCMKQCGCRIVDTSKIAEEAVYKELTDMADDLESGEVV